MAQPKIFVASSTEGLEVAKTVRSLLGDALRGTAEPVPWTRAFDLSATYIESLEKAAEEADFAVIVVTPDDLTISRDRKRVAPRDNVVFELGLFMGSLGRERCYVVMEQSPDLKLPTDTLGMHFAAFRRSANQSLTSLLDKHCLDISDRVAKLRNKFRPPRDILAMQVSQRRFCESIEGMWWERITTENVCALSFFRIEYDPLYNSVSLAGRSYNPEGQHVANWNSVIARVDRDKRKVVYHWEGWYTVPDLANAMFRGFGVMEFEQPLDAGEAVIRGGGKFWDVDESRPEKTMVKLSQLRRVTAPGAGSVMTTGTEKAIRVLIKKTLDSW
jgi:hypothetical protein